MTYVPNGDPPSLNSVNNNNGTSNRSRQAADLPRIISKPSMQNINGHSSYEIGSNGRDTIVGSCAVDPNLDWDFDDHTSESTVIVQDS